MNRIIGTLFTLATLAIVAYAIYNAGEYSSMCFDREPIAPRVEATDVKEAVEEVADTTAVVVPDSVEMVDEIREIQQVGD